MTAEPVCWQRDCAGREETQQAKPCRYTSRRQKGERAQRGPPPAPPLGLPLPSDRSVVVVGVVLHHFGMLARGGNVSVSLRGRDGGHALV